jgi:hypothetical protein
MGDRLSAADRDRGVSTVVGFILIFAMLIILLSMYQALWVPIQNEEVEFDHYQGVKDDMTNVRSAIFEARTTGEIQSTTVKLGTRYPSRMLAINPPPATGTLSAGEPRDISITAQDGTPIDIATRYTGIDSADQVYTQLLSYEPTYRELDSGAPIRHEHGVLFMNFSESQAGGGIVVHNDDQQLVRTPDGRPNRTIIVPLQGNYSESGVERVSIDPEPGILETKEFTDVNVTVPTKLDEPTWESLLAEHLPPENVVVDRSAEELTLVLDGTWEVQYAPVGVAGVPPSGTRGSLDRDINPASPGDVRLTQASRDQNADEWVITFENQAGTTNISEARVNFYPGTATAVEYINDPLASRTVNWNIGDDFKLLDPPIELTGNATTDITFGFDKVDGNDEWWVLTVIFESGEQGTYFVSEGGTATTGNSDPTVTIDSTDVTTRNNGNYDVTVTFTASDPDNDVDSYTVSLYNDTDEVTLIGSQTDGTFTGGTTSVSFDNVKSQDYTAPFWVVVEVTDATGRTGSDSTQTGT